MEELLNSQSNQKYIFESPEVIKEAEKESKEEVEEKGEVGVEVKEEVVEEVQEVAKEQERKKPLPQIPNSMPVNERRQIRLEIDMLFGSGDDSDAK